MNKTQILKGKIILAGWVSLNHLSDKERVKTAWQIGQIIIKNTEWKGKKHG